MSRIKQLTLYLTVENDGVMKMSINAENRQAAVPEELAQYLTFKLDGEAFATNIAKVREVLEYEEITRVPGTLDYMQGVINVRGSVVPVVDLRKQFSLGISEPTVDTCIIISEVAIDDMVTIVGVFADSVQEVIELGPEQMEPAPTMGSRINTQYIQAMGKLEEGFLIILDMDKVFSMDQINELNKGLPSANDGLDYGERNDEMATA